MEEKNTVCLIPAAEDDLDAVCTLCRRVAAANPESHWSDNYPSRQLLEEDIRSGHLYKAELDGRLASIMLIHGLDSYLGEEESRDNWSDDLENPCALGRFCVSPDFQGRGLGRRVMAASLEKARSLGYGAAVFHAVKNNGPALHIYDTMGFSRTGEVQAYGEDFICYEIRL